jgi:hypothetical protein
VIQSRPLGIKPYYVIGLLEFVGIIAALKFMWDAPEEFNRLLEESIQELKSESKGY